MACESTDEILAQKWHVTRMAHRPLGFDVSVESRALNRKMCDLGSQREGAVEEVTTCFPIIPSDLLRYFVFPMPMNLASEGLDFLVHHSRHTFSRETKRVPLNY